VTAQPTLDQKIAALKPKVPDEFSRDVLDGARHALADTENPLRYNFFSTAIRILIEHMMDTLAPNDEVPRSKWFKPETASGRPTRAQRIVFAIQGEVDPVPLRERLLEAYEDLNKHVHGRENTIITDIAEQDAAADSSLAAVESFLDSIQTCARATG
jgi:Predicted pPIWI-associating nuclease